jgi:hypothetical protein
MPEGGLGTHGREVPRGWELRFHLGVGRRGCARESTPPSLWGVVAYLPDALGAEEAGRDKTPSVPFAALLACMSVCVGHLLRA